MSFGKGESSALVKKLCENYSLTSTVASGSFATVKLAKHNLTGERVAIKFINKKKISEEAKEHVSSEIKCLKIVEHPNIVMLYDLYESETQLFLVMELGDSDLYDHIMKHYKNVGMTEALVRYYSIQLISAIIYCHNARIVHRDLKPQNILIFKEKNIIKIADFGFSRVYNPGQNLQTACGSLPYIAPEVLLGEGYEPKAADMWSIAVILVMMFTGNLPFFHINQSEMLTLVLDCKYSLPSTLSNNARILISKILKRKPDERLKFEYIFEEAFYKEKTKSFYKTSKVVNISPILHEYVLSALERKKVGLREDIVQTLKQKHCNYLSACYYLVAGNIFKKAAGKNTVNYILNVPSALLFSENEEKNEASLTNGFNDTELLDKILSSMDDVSAGDSKKFILSLENFRQPLSHAKSTTNSPINDLQASKIQLTTNSSTSNLQALKIQSNTSSSTNHLKNPKATSYHSLSDRHFNRSKPYKSKIFMRTVDTSKMYHAKSLHSLNELEAYEEPVKNITQSLNCIYNSVKESGKIKNGGKNQKVEASFDLSEILSQNYKDGNEVEMNKNEMMLKVQHKENFGILKLKKTRQTSNKKHVENSHESCNKNKNFDSMLDTQM